MYNPILFEDRDEAGEELGQELKKLELKNPLVLAIPSGGVPIGVAVARILKCPLDLMIVRKIQFPWTTEAGFGALSEDGTLWLGPAARELSKEAIEIQVQKAIKEVEQRKKEFLKGRKRPDIKGKTVILVDDGLAAGSTMFVAIQSAKKKKPRSIIIAAPVASGAAVNLLKNQADKIVTLYQHPEGLPFAVASSYCHWHDLTDDEVKQYL